IAPVTVDDEESVAAIEDTEVEAAAEAADAPAAEIAPVAEVPAAEAAPRAIAAPAQTRIGAAPLGLPAPSDADPWMIGRGGFCVEQRLQQRLERNFGITSLAFAPDGRLFMGLDSPSTGDGDPNILFDAFHPSRSVVVYNTAAADQFYT